MSKAIVTGGTKSDVAPMAVMAINLRNTNSKVFDELVIFHDGIKRKDQILINQIFPTRFIKYNYPYSSKNDEILSYFSPMLFCKYECFRLLKEYDTVVWSDYDVVILDSLEEFCRFDDYSMNIVTGTDSLRSMFYKKLENKEELEKYDLAVIGMSTPIFGISNSLVNSQEICDWCYLKTKEWDSDLYLPEQCVFSLALQEFNVTYNIVPYRRYVTLPEDPFVGDEIIIHAAGQPKFWNGRKNEAWDEMYREWVALGGTKYKDWKKKLKRQIIFVITRLWGIRGKQH